MPHLTHCCFFLTTSSAATTTYAKLSSGWLGRATATLTRPRALTFPYDNIYLSFPPN